jgi:hypothetical protein
MRPGRTEIPGWETFPYPDGSGCEKWYTTHILKLKAHQEIMIATIMDTAVPTVETDGLNCW